MKPPGQPRVINNHVVIMDATHPKEKSRRTELPDPMGNSVMLRRLAGDTTTLVGFKGFGLSTPFLMAKVDTDLGAEDDIVMDRGQ